MIHHIAPHLFNVDNIKVFLATIINALSLWIAIGADEQAFIAWLFAIITSILTSIYVVFRIKKIRLEIKEMEDGKD